MRPFTLTRHDLYTQAIALGAWVIAFAATVHFKPLFAPDSRYYAAMSLSYGGDSQAAAAREVAARSAEQGWQSPGVDLLFGWGLVQPRVVYPALSTPFVKVFGIDGLAVVPAVASALLIVVATALIARRWGNLAALVPVLLVCTSPNLIFWFAAMLTESLTALWTALLLAIVWRHQREPNRWLAVALVAVTVLSGFTRQSTLIPAGAFVAAWFLALVLRGDHRRWRVPAAAVGATAIVVQLLQMWWFPSFSQAEQFKLKTGADSLAEAIAAAPRLAATIIRTDIQNMAIGDRPLLLLLVLSIVSMVIFWRRSESHMLFGALCAYALYNVTNGTPTMFRYGTPGLVFVMISVAVLVAATVKAPLRTVGDTSR